MRFSYWDKVDATYFNDPSTRMILSASIRSDKVDALKNDSVKLMDGKIQVAHNGDDFIHNRLTVLRTYTGVKVPRYLKNYLLSKI